MNLKIATWNISCGIPLEWEFSTGIEKQTDYKKFGLIDDVIETINREQIDIIGLQESVNFKNGDKSFANIISDNTNLKYYSTFEVSDCHLIENANIEEVVLSRFPIIKSENVLFENLKFTKKSNNGIIYKLFDDGFIISDIKINNSLTISFTTGHALAFQVFGKKPEDYVESYKILENNIKKQFSSNKAMFVVGDYNTEFLLDMLPFFKENFINYVEGATYVVENTSIDYILAEKNIKFISKQKIKNQSNHYLCIANFVL